MSDQNLEITPRSAESARAAWQAADHQDHRWVLYCAIAVASLLVGVAGTVFALRSGAAEAREASQTAVDHSAHQAVSDPPAASQPGGGVYISPARQQLIGVRTAVVEHRALETTVRTVGVLQYDETRV